MMAHIIDGKKIALELQASIFDKIKERACKNLPVPGLAVILVGDNHAAEIYVRNKQKACEQVGVFSQLIRFSEYVSEEELLRIINSLNENKKIHGILVQLPLPKHINEQKIITAINYKKDVDGFHPYNLGLLAQKIPLLRPCTPSGIIYLADYLKLNLTGKDAVVVGASKIVGLPMALELLMKKATVTICHLETKNLVDKIKRADVVVAAAGCANLIKGDWIKEGAAVFDVGINRLENGAITGDVEFAQAKERASFITPVPGGVGPMTIAMLLSNTLLAATLQDI